MKEYIWNEAYAASVGKKKIYFFFQTMFILENFFLKIRFFSSVFFLKFFLNAFILLLKVVWV